ncbi:MAG: hypothetical protein ACYSTF_00895 [Planctomycetota bacterium]
MIQRLCVGHVSESFPMKVVDEIVQLSNKELLDMAKRLAREGGILSWILSSAVVAAVVKIAKLRANINKLVVALCCAVEGYLSTGFSTGLFHENECRRLQNHVDAAKFFAVGTCEDTCEADSGTNEWRR